MNSKIKYILTDIEGTTTSISFVTDVLFPYFRNHIEELKIDSSQEVKEAFEDTKKIAFELESITLNDTEEIIKHLLKWSLEDKKYTPLKKLQGILWKKAYENGEIKGHIYTDVPEMLLIWSNLGIKLGVFSSGSIEAQKLIFGFSVYGDLSPYFSDYFDTNTGGKREVETYQKIASILKINSENILFLSDIQEELLAAKNAGMNTIQLVRENIVSNWEHSVSSFDLI